MHTATDEKKIIFESLVPVLIKASYRIVFSDPRILIENAFISYKHKSKPCD